jgi:hypothetical protein
MLCYACTRVFRKTRFPEAHGISYRCNFPTGCGIGHPMGHHHAAVHSGFFGVWIEIIASQMGNIGGRAEGLTVDISRRKLQREMSRRALRAVIRGKVELCSVMIGLAFWRSRGTRGLEVRFGAYLACVEMEIKTTTHEQLIEMMYIWSIRLYLLLFVSSAMAYVVDG